MEGSDRQPTVLVVDDEQPVADTYSELLAARYDVRTAYTGEEALELLDLDVDVVLLDRRMPDPSGDEVLSRIRARGYSCRVVMITAVEPGVDILSLDFDEYVTKPVEADDLFEVVEAMLARTEYLRRVQEAVALASKMATLEAKMDLDELEESDAYQEAQRRFHELRGEIEYPPKEGLFTQLAQEKIEVLFES